MQIFDTWGGLLDREDYVRFCIPAIRRITEPLRAKGRKVLLFVRGGQHLLPVLGEADVDGFSLDWRADWREARTRYPRHILQGNLDPALLLAGPRPRCARPPARCLRVMREADEGAPLHRQPRPRHPQGHASRDRRRAVRRGGESWLNDPTCWWWAVGSRASPRRSSCNASAVA